MSILEKTKQLLPGKSKRTGDFKRRRRYRLSFVNLSSLTPVFELTIKRYEVWTTAIGLFFLAGLVWLCAFIYTPLRNILPAKMQTDLRDEYVDLSLRLDSIIAVANTNDAYLNNLMLALSDSASIAKRSESETIAQTLPLDSLLESTAAERSFVSRFEDAERYNLSVLSPIAAEGMTFYPPISGVSIDSRVSDAGIPSVSIKPGKSTPVSAVYRGTVIGSHFTTGKGITLMVQHPNDFVSVYTGLAETFVSRGDKVTAGMRLGLGQQDRYPMAFELWHNGVPLAPSDYIIFN